MTKRLFVGNLPYNITEGELEEAFGDFGVSDVHIPVDRMSGRPRGFAFVTIAEDKINEAISTWDGKELSGRALTVNEAQPRQDRGGGGGGGGRGGGDRW
jgi:cold-inducible RNA-binding protein